MGKSTRVSEDQGPLSFCGYSIHSGRQRGQTAQKSTASWSTVLENQHLNAAGEAGEDFPQEGVQLWEGTQVLGRSPGGTKLQQMKPHHPHPAQTRVLVPALHSAALLQVQLVPSLQSC